MRVKFNIESLYKIFIFLLIAMYMLEATSIPNVNNSLFHDVIQYSALLVAIIYIVDELFAIKVLQTSGRAITQSRYNKWESINEQRRYLKKIRDDSMLEDNLKYLLDVKEKLQIDHYILLKFLKARLFNLIILVLKIRNII